MARHIKKPKPVVISPQAKGDLLDIFFYLNTAWSQKAIDRFIRKLENFYFLISLQPRLFSFYNNRKNIRKYAITRHFLVFYRNKKNTVEIIAVIDGRRKPSTVRKKLK